MIPLAFIDAWTNQVPWSSRAQVEQDLAISRALVEIFSDEYIRENVAFRGGTALHKIYFQPPGRYSEDIDLCRTTTGAAKPLLDRFHEILNPWLGKPRAERGAHSVKMIYRFQSESEPPQPMRLKVEINVRETYNLLGLRTVRHSIENPWFTGQANVVTYSLEELLATKLRALYQRRKGRDLFDLHQALTLFPDLDVQEVIRGFIFYLKKSNLTVSQEDFEANLEQKETHRGFREDIQNLLPSTAETYDFDTALLLIREEIISQLPQ